MALERGAPPTKTLVLLAVKVAISVVLLWSIFKRVGWSQVVDAIRHARPEWFAAALTVMLASNLLGAYQWGRLLRGAGIALPFWKTASYYHVGLFFNNFTPANVGGDFARVLDASRAGHSRATAFSTVLLDRLIGTVALGALAVVTTLPAINHFHLALVYAGLLGFFLLSVTILWAIFHPRLLSAIERVLTAVGLGRLRPALDDLAESLAGFRHQRRLFMELFTVALFTQVLRIGVHVLMARALGLHIATSYFFLFVPALAVIVSLPISFNGIGLREWAGALFFDLVRLPHDKAVALQSATYVVSFIVSLLGGIVFLARIPRRRAEARSSRRPSE